MGTVIKDYIQFMNFNSKNEKLYLMERDAPTPDEKEILKDLPFRHGVLDFSMLLGDRVFKNRTLTYTFLYLDTKEKQIYQLETRIKQKLMVHGRNKIYDTHDPNYYWLGKCKSVKADRDTSFNRLKVTVEFDCYPYMFSHTNYFDDYWDSFEFDDDVANYSKYIVKESLSFPLYNAGVVSVRPQIIVDSHFSVTVNDEKSIIFEPSRTGNYYISLRPGVNEVRVEGNGTIQFHYQREVMG